MAVGDKHFLETGLQKSKRQKDKQGKMNRTTKYQNKKEYGHPLCTSNT